MLIKRADLDRIVTGEVDLAFRRWRRPTVKAGGTLRTSVGMLDIIAIDEIDAAHITAAEAQRAGYPDREPLLADLDQRTDGVVYRVEVRYGGDDPRIALREAADLSPDDIDELDTRLARLDRASKRGPWTTATLELLEANPHVRAPDLAEPLGLETATFKNDVRKLKTLGLTISHSPGYELSPRGRAYLSELRRRPS